MFKLDLSKFKKLSADKDHTVMQHKDGHTIKIAHKPLHPHVKAQLDALTAMEGPKQDPEPMAKGGQVANFSDGTDNVQPGPADPANNSGVHDFTSGMSSGQKAAPKPAPQTQASPSASDQPTVDVHKAVQSGQDQTAKDYWKTHGHAPPGQANGGRVNYDDGGNVDANGGGGIDGAIGTIAKLAPLIAAMSKGGFIKDPTQEHLLPGDKMPNAIEKNVVNSTRSRMCAGGMTPDSSSAQGGAAMMAQGGRVPGKANYAAPQGPVSQDDVSAPLSQGDIKELANQQDPNASFLPEPKGRQDSADQIAADAQANQPTGPNAQYAPLYQNELDQIRKNNPGQPEIINQQMALDAATNDKKGLLDSNSKNIAAQQQVSNAAQVINQKKTELGLPPDQTPPSPSQQNSPASASNTGQSIDQITQSQTPPQIQDPYGMNDAYNMWTQGMQQRLAGIQKEAAVTGQLGTQQAGVLGNAVDAQKQLLAHAQDQYNQLNQERLHTLDDLDNQHIDPKKYVNNMSTGSKIASIIGIALGGGSSAITGQPNLAYNTLQANIGRDIDAQKANMSKSQNMLANNLAQFGNLRDATQWQHTISQDVIAYGLQQKAASMAPGMAQANALKLSGQLRQDSSQMVAQMGMRRAMMNFTQQSAQNPQQFNQALQLMRMTNPEMAKEMESRYVPGVGIASIPVPQSVRDNLMAKQQLDARAKDLYAWASQHSGSLSPTDIAVGQAKAAELQSMYRNAINGGVFKKGEQDFIDKIVDSNPTQFFNSIRSQPRLKTVIQSNQAQMNMLKQQYQLPVPAQYAPKTFKKAK